MAWQNCPPLLFLLVVGWVSGQSLPEGPQGPPGAILKYDLLSNSQPGINYPSGPHLGAFVAQDWPPGRVNDELQAYKPDAATQNPSTNEITITATKVGDYIKSARLESHQVWTTAQSGEIKKRGYLEVRAKLPARRNGNSNLAGSWPAIWMLGTGNGWEWPRHGEIDIVEVVNGVPDVVMSLHSTNHHGGGPQHPPDSPFKINADVTETPAIFGFEWNVREDVGQIDLTWWLTNYDLGAQQWVQQHTTKVLFIGQDNDYMDFYESFNGEGFSLLINLAEGGVFPGVYHPDGVIVDGQPQYLVVSSAKVYGF